MGSSGKSYWISKRPLGSYFMWVRDFELVLCFIYIFCSFTGITRFNTCFHRMMQRSLIEERRVGIQYELFIKSCCVINCLSVWYDHLVILVVCEVEMLTCGFAQLCFDLRIQQIWTLMVPTFFEWWYIFFTLGTIFFSPVNLWENRTHLISFMVKNWILLACQSFPIIIMYVTFRCANVRMGMSCARNK